MAELSTPNIKSSAVPPVPTTLPSFPHAPAPWTTKCTNYLFAIRVSPTTPLPNHIVYSPLSASHAPFSSEALAGKYRGGLATVQIVRYTETPLGPYDELVIIPGDFEVPVLSGGGGSEGEGGKKKKVKKNTRMTGIWVSQKDTCWNGRKNWNLPKHLARFTFTPHNPPSPSSSSSASTSFPPPPLTVTVSPYHPPTAPPFFTCTILPVSYFPFSFPLSTSCASLLGLDLHLVQPALPTGLEDEPELCGSEDWKRVLPVLRSKTARVVWIDLRQPSVAAEGRRGEEGEAEEEAEEEEEGDALLGKGGSKSEEENWWPGGRRWRLGIWFKDAELTLDEPEVLG